MRATATRYPMIASKRLQAGLSLIELMIALILGLVVTGAAGAVFLANKQAYGTSETLNRIQEGERTSFEIMSRDLREAGGNPCSMTSRVISQLKAGDNTWWTSYAGGLFGYRGGQDIPGTATGNAVAQRVAGTDAVDLHLANEGDIRVTSHDNPSANLQVSNTNGLAIGDVLLVCNMDYSFIFEVTQLNSSGGGAIQHNGGGGGGALGNCSQEFQYERNCVPGASGDKGYCFMVADPSAANPNCAKAANSPAEVVRVTTARWYIGNNARDGTSLYRATVFNNSGTTVPNQIDTVEIVEGVTDMDIGYLIVGEADYRPAAGMAADDWQRVIAVRVELEFEGTDGALRGTYIRGTDGEVLSRRVTNVVALRNREALL